MYKNGKSKYSRWRIVFCYVETIRHKFLFIVPNFMVCVTFQFQRTENMGSVCEGFHPAGFELRTMVCPGWLESLEQYSNAHHCMWSEEGESTWYGWVVWVRVMGDTACYRSGGWYGGGGVGGGAG